MGKSGSLEHFLSSSHTERMKTVCIEELHRWFPGVECFETMGSRELFLLYLYLCQCISDRDSLGACASPLSSQFAPLRSAMRDAEKLLAAIGSDQISLRFQPGAEPHAPTFLGRMGGGGGSHAELTVREIEECLHTLLEADAMIQSIYAMEKNGADGCVPAEWKAGGGKVKHGMWQPLLEKEQERKRKLEDMQEAVDHYREEFCVDVFDVNRIGQVLARKRLSELSVDRIREQQVLQEAACSNLRRFLCELSVACLAHFFVRSIEAKGSGSILVAVEVGEDGFSVCSTCLATKEEKTCRVSLTDAGEVQLIFY